MSKYVLQMNVVGSNVPINNIARHIPAAEDDRVWADEYSVEIGETEDGKPTITAHVPFNGENDARSIHGEIGALNGVLASADEGYIHVHECPTGGSEEAWSCDDRIILDLHAGTDGGGEPG